jgi:DNA helicase II / ATP-dependent DNA helicase PcrA
LRCNSEYHDAEIIAQGLKNIARNRSLDTTAILYRSHYQSRALEEALIRYGIPYKIIGGIQFYERQEIKDLLAYLRLIVNPFDRVSLLRVINCPARGLGDKFQEQFIEIWDQNNYLDFKNISQKILGTENLTKVKQQSLEQFLEIYKKLEPMQSPSQALSTILTTTNYFTYLKDNFDKEDTSTKTDNVKELLHAVSFFETQGITTVAALLDEIALMQEHITKDATAQCVKLMTIHAAKGLEFNTVFLTGLEEGVFPSNHAMQEPSRLEEERRLLYVAITRAQERLLITHTNYRYTWGQMSKQDPSQFLKEMAIQTAQYQDASHWTVLQCMSYFNLWFTNN